MVIIWYGIIPLTGTVFKRYTWRLFRRRFDELRLRPILDYGIYRRLDSDGTTFRFTGGVESVTDRQTLWIQGENLTIPVSLAGAKIFLLPMQKGNDTPDVFDPGEEELEQLKWDKISALTEGARVYVGGAMIKQDERWIFIATRETPLLIIFYDGPDYSLTPRTIQKGRQRNEYWNLITPYSLAIGALSQILIALGYLNRPTFRLTVITSIIALFIPLFPLIPPGILFTTIHRRLALQARIYRAYRDLMRLPLRYLIQQDSLQQSAALPDGEKYGMVHAESFAGEIEKGNIPLLIPGYSKKQNTGWYVFVAVHAGSEIPVQPADPFATYGALPGEPQALSKRYAKMAYVIEVIAWLMLFAGIGINIFFVNLILSML